MASGFPAFATQQKGFTALAGKPTKVAVAQRVKDWWPTCVDGKVCLGVTHTTIAQLFFS